MTLRQLVRSSTCGGVALERRRKFAATVAAMVWGVQRKHQRIAAALALLGVAFYALLLPGHLTSQFNAQLYKADVGMFADAMCLSGDQGYKAHAGDELPDLQGSRRLPDGHGPAGTRRAPGHAACLGRHRRPARRRGQGIDPATAQPRPTSPRLSDCRALMGR